MPRHRKGDVPIPGYTLDELLGSGGTKCQVWSAHGNAGNKVAIKFLPLVEGKQDLAAREARTLVRNLKFISHPFLLPIHRVELFDAAGNPLDLDELAADEQARRTGADDGARGTVVVPRVRGTHEMVIVMGLADESLADKLDDCHRVPHDELLKYMEDAADALDYLNRRDDARQKPAIQHGDIKPQNIMLLAGRVQICDYGLARALREDDVRQTTSVAGHSPAYAAPEVITTRFAGPRSDQFSLAVTYYELRTGRLPFPDHFVERRQFEDAILDGKLDLSELVDPAERQVIARATSVNPDERFATVKEMVDKLRAAGTQPLPPLTRSADEESPDEEVFDVSQSLAKATIPDRPLAKDDVVLGYRLEDLVFEEGNVTAWLSKTAKGKSSRLIYVRELAEDVVDTKALKLFETELVHDHLWRPDQVCLVDAAGHVATIDAGGQVALPTGTARAGQRWCKAILIGPKARRSLNSELHENKYYGLDAHVLLPQLRKLAEVLDVLNDPQHLLRNRRFAVVHGNVQPAHCLKRWDKHTQNYAIVQLGNPLWARVLEKDELDLGGSGPPGGQFCAPEIAEGRVTRFSDQYSLAASYVRLRTGHWPFDPAASTERVDEARRRGELDLTGLFEAEKGVIGKAMAYEPRERYSSCVALVTALQKAVHSREFDQTVPVLSPGQVDTDDAAAGDELLYDAALPATKRDTDEEPRTDHPTEPASAEREPKSTRATDVGLSSPAAHAQTAAWPAGQPKHELERDGKARRTSTQGGTLLATPEVERTPSDLAVAAEGSLEPAGQRVSDPLSFRERSKTKRAPRWFRRLAAAAALISLTGSAWYGWMAGGTLVEDCDRRIEDGDSEAAQDLFENANRFVRWFAIRRGLMIPDRTVEKPIETFEQAIAKCTAALISGDTSLAISEFGRGGKLDSGSSDSRILEQTALELFEHCEGTVTAASESGLIDEVKEFYRDIASRGYLDPSRLDVALSKLNPGTLPPVEEFQKNLADARRLLRAGKLASAEQACENASKFLERAGEQEKAQLQLVLAQIDLRKAVSNSDPQAWDAVARRLADVGVEMLDKSDRTIYWALNVVRALAQARPESHPEEIVNAFIQLALPDDLARDGWEGLDRAGAEFRHLRQSFSNCIGREFERGGEATSTNETIEPFAWLIKLRPYLPPVPNDPLQADLDAAQALTEIARQFARSGADYVTGNESSSAEPTVEGEEEEALEQFVRGALGEPLGRMSAENVVPCCTVLTQIALNCEMTGAANAALAALSPDEGAWDRLGVDRADQIDALRGKLRNRAVALTLAHLRRRVAAEPVSPRTPPAENVDDPAWLYACRAETLVETSEQVPPDAWKKASAYVGKAREVLKRADPESSEEKPYVSYVYALCTWRRPEGAKYDKASLDEVVKAFEADAQTVSPFLSSMHRRKRACELAIDAAEYHRRLYDPDDEKLKRLAPALDAAVARQLSAWLALPASFLNQEPDLLNHQWLRRFRLNETVALSCAKPDSERSLDEWETLRKLCEALNSDESGTNLPQFCLIHARAISASNPAQAVDEYAKVLRSFEVREGQYAMRPLSDLRIYLVSPALELDAKVLSPNLATKQSLAALYAAKGRLLHDAPETAPSSADATQSAARLASWERAIDLDGQRQAYYVERGLARLASPSISADVIQAVKERDLKPAQEYGPPTAGVHELTLRTAVFESRSPKPLDVRITLLKNAIDAYGEAIAKLGQDPPPDLLVAGSMAHLELANYISGSPEDVRKHLESAVELATRATRDETRPHPEMAWLALGNAQEDFGWVLWDGDVHYPLAVVAFDNAVGNAQSAAAFSLFNRGRCRYKWAQWQKERGGNPAQLILDAEGDLTAAVESQGLAPVHEAESHDWLSGLATLIENTALAESEAKKAAETLGERDSLWPALRIKCARLQLQRADEFKRANKIKQQEDYLHAAEELARIVIAANRPRDEIAGAVETLAYARLARGGTPDETLKLFQDVLPKDLKDTKSEHVDLLIARAWITFYVRDGFGANRTDKLRRFMRDGADAARRLAAGSGDMAREIAALWLIAEHDADVWKTTRRPADATKAVESWQAVLDAEPLTPPNSHFWLKLAELKLAIGASASAANKAAWKNQARELLAGVQRIETRRLTSALKTSLDDLLTLCK
jgi:serine/threonine protein kinase